MPPRDDADEIKARLNENLEQLLSYFWPGHVKRGRMAYCAPNGARDLGSFQVYLAPSGKYQRGSWVRSSRDLGGDPLNLFAYGLSGETNHHADAETFRRAREWVGLDNRREETPEERGRRESIQAAAAAKREADDRRAREHAQARVRTAAEIWAESVPISGTHAEAYLLARGIPVPPEGWGESLRYNPAVIYDLDRSLSFPTLVCRVDDMFGDLTAIWKIHLDPKKPTKAPVDKAKIGAGVAAGGAVRLGGIGPHVGIGEGVETCLAARALFKYRFPVWAGLSTSGVVGFELPIDVERVTVVPDGDKPWRQRDGDIEVAEPAGRAAARKLWKRMSEAGTPCNIAAEPNKNQDYLDKWKARRARDEATA